MSLTHLAKFTQRFDELIGILNDRPVMAFTVGQLRRVNSLIRARDHLRLGHWDTPDGEGRHHPDLDARLIKEMEQLAGAGKLVARPRPRR